MALEKEKVECMMEAAIVKVEEVEEKNVVVANLLEKEECERVVVGKVSPVVPKEG